MGTWEIAAKSLAGVGSIFGALGFLFGVLKAPIGLGLVSLWARVDALRNAKRLGHAIAEVGSQVLVFLSVIAWLFAAFGIAALAIAPERILDEAVSHLPNLASLVRESGAARAMRAVTQPYVVAIGVLLAILLIVGVIEFTTSEGTIARKRGELFVEILAAASLIGLLAWLTYGTFTQGKSIYLHVLPQLTQVYFAEYTSLTLGDLALFVWITSSLAAVPFIFVMYAVPLLILYANRKLDYFLPSLVADLYGRAILPATVFFAGLITSFGVSMFAAYAGAHLKPDEHVNLSAQVLASNALFDGFTLAATAALFKWAALPIRAFRDEGKLRKWVSDYESDKAAYGAFNLAVKAHREAVKAGTAKRKDRPRDVENPDTRLSEKGRQVVLPYLQWLPMFDPSRKRSLRRNTWGDALTHAELSRNIDEIELAIGQVERSTGWRLWPALLADLFFASLCAYGSVYFAFAGTSSALTLDEMHFVFTAGYQNGKLTDLGPLFWLMHSSFLPTVIFWAILLAGAFAGFVISPLADIVLRIFAGRNAAEAEDVAQKAVQDARDALIKTGSFFGGIGAVLSALLFVGWLH